MRRGSSRVCVGTWLWRSSRLVEDTPPEWSPNPPSPAGLQRTQGGSCLTQYACFFYVYVFLGGFLNTNNTWLHDAVIRPLVSLRKT